MLFILITLAIDAMGLGIVIPVLPDVIRRFISGEAQVSRIYGYFIALYALMQFIASPLLGSLSDRYGRRPILLLSLFGAAVDYLFMAFAGTLPLLFLGRLIAGISGASYTVASAYVADISDDSNRSKNFGVIGAGFGLGFIAGPAVGGLLASYRPEYAFIAAAALNGLNFLFGFFVLPESLALENRRPFSWQALNPFRSLMQVFRLKSIRALLVVHVLFQFGGQTHPSIWTLYTRHRFEWTPSQVGLSLAAVGLLSAISQGVLTGYFVKKFGERKVLSIGTLGEAISFAFFGIASTGTFLYITLLFSSVFWAAPPTLQSLISREVPANEQGELQGSLMSLTSITAVINPLVMTTLFSMTSNPNSAPYLPGAVYFFAGFLILIAWMVVYGWARTHRI